MGGSHDPGRIDQLAIDTSQPRGDIVRNREKRGDRPDRDDGDISESEPYDKQWRQGDSRYRHQQREEGIDKAVAAHAEPCHHTDKKSDRTPDAESQKKAFQGGSEMCEQNGTALGRVCQQPPEVLQNE